MADIAIGRDMTLPRLRLQAVEWVLAHRAVVALASLMAVAAVLRLWELDAKALHHDESLHATYSWYLAEGRGYQHDPLMHGPFQFHMNALMFFLFGATDFTARLGHAIFGTALVGMPWLLRKQIGVKASLIASTLLLISPTLLYFSRFDREDIYVAVWTFAIVISIWRYLDEGKPLFLYTLAASLALAYATKESTAITVAIVLVFIDVMLAVELGKGREGEKTTQNWVGRLIVVMEYAIVAVFLGVRKVFGHDLFEDPKLLLVLMGVIGAGSLSLILPWLKDPKAKPDSVVRVVSLLPVAWLIAAAWPLLGRKPFGREEMPRTGDILVVVGTLALPQFSAVTQIILGNNEGYNAVSEQEMKVISVFVLIIASAYVGLFWRPKQWLIVAVCFYLPFVLLYTTFFTNQPAPWTHGFWDGNGGFFSGIWGSLDYWLDQHREKRGSQPIYYYSILTGLYEFLPLLLAMGGAAWMALRGKAIGRWLLFWAAMSFVGYSLAGERMPWLEVHIALPLIIVAAVALSRTLDSVEMLSEGRWLGAVGTAALAGVAVLILVEGDGAVRLAGWLLVAGLMGWALASWPSAGFKTFARAGLAVALGVLFTLTVRASLTLSFENYDTPVEMLVYVQTSPDIPELMDRIEAQAKATGLGHNLPIAIDTSSGFVWPWVWYLRDYHEIHYVEPTRPGFQDPGSVMLIHRSNAALVDATGYNELVYKHRWWFDETYRSLLPDDIENKRGLFGDVKLLASNLFDLAKSPSRMEALGDFFLHRRPVEGFTGSEDGVAYFPQSGVAEPENLGQVAPTVAPDGRIAFGRAGDGPGELFQPADIFVDGEGSIWVADSGNSRIEKFSATGEFIESFGDRPGGVSLNEPWSMAVDNDGFIYVADTWDHRIVKLAPDGKEVAAWGKPAVTAAPSLLELFGPRDIVLATDGTLWVTDTGNKRLVHYTKDGTPLGSYGREGSNAGEFHEPVGLVRDAAGRFYVADTWNGRIQRLEADLTPSGAFATGWTSQDILAKPYIAVLTDGRIVAAEPAKGLILIYDGNGQPQSAWQLEAGSMPVGIAALPDGGFVFSDIKRNQVQIIPGALIDSLGR